LDLEEHVFESTSPKHIAESVKRSAEKSKRRKGTPYQSAMSMLNFYSNRAGKNLSARQKQIIEKAKQKLRELFGRVKAVRTRSK
jgi:putative cell wall-binding protein